ncbi:MAG: deoxyribose-phosphate aldolase [Actinobacteria bacterium]|nr:deoxyribose-phosphate aldolase [Actinomycetota bacterium]
MKNIFGISFDELKNIIDYTLLKPQETRAKYVAFIDEAMKWSFGAVFVPSCHVALAANYLAGSTVKVGTVVSFPYGFASPEAKADESVVALEDGATEIDVVMNISEALSENWDAVGEDLSTVSFAVREWEKYSGADPVVLKAILETPYLSDEQITEACRRVEGSGFNYVKTATGVGPGGAKSENVSIMRAAVGDRLGVKASGGIRTWKDVCGMLSAGADRVGTSAGPQIMEEYLVESM